MKVFDPDPDGRRARDDAAELQRRHLSAVIRCLDTLASATFGPSPEARRSTFLEAVALVARAPEQVPPAGEGLSPFGSSFPEAREALVICLHAWEAERGEPLDEPSILVVLALADRTAERFGPG